MKSVETLIEYQLEDRNRITALFRIILVLPPVLLLAFYTNLFHIGIGFMGAITAPVVLTLLFRNVYPSYVLDFNHAMFEFYLRITAYSNLLTDDYPSIERNPKFAIIFDDTEGGKRLNRWLPLVKWFISLPVAFVGVIYSIGGFVVWALSLLTILFTGTMPVNFAEYLVKNIKYWNRYLGYTVFLVTDKYPTFKLD
jgi:hypothetical protein